MAENSLTKIDRRDRKILNLLQQDAHLTNAELADQVGLSPSPCLRRVKRLEDEGFIQNYRASVNREKLGYPVMAFAQVTLSSHEGDALELLEKTIVERPEVINAYLMTGSSDYLIQVVAKSLEDYTRFIREYITQQAAVQTIQTSFCLQIVVDNKPIPVD